MAQTLLLTGKDKNRLLAAAEELAKNSSSSFDILLFDSEENKGISLTRELISQSHRKPYNSKILTIILQNAGKLTLEAQNSLLKIIEEPPEETQIIFTSTNKNNLLPTVVSRCLEIRIDEEGKSKKVSSLFENFFGENFGKKLEILEKSDLEDYLTFLHETLLKELLENKKTSNLSELTRKIKLALKLSKASQNSANKKLISLILAQN